MGKKKFINKKTAQKYALVRRPFQENEDENAPKYELVPIDNHRSEKQTIDDKFDQFLQQQCPDIDLSTIERCDPSTSSALPHDHDYTKHMRSINEAFFTPKEGINGSQTEMDALRNRSCATEPAYEGPKYSLNKSGLRPKESGEFNTARPTSGNVDFFSALDGGSDVEYEELADDFMVDALGDDSGEEEEQEIKEDISRVRFDDESDTELDICDRLDRITVDELGPETMLDAQFEHLLDAYTDDEIGELDEEEVHGDLSISQLDGVLDEFLDKKHRRRVETDPNADATLHAHRGLSYLEQSEPTDESSEQIERNIDATFKKPEKEKWDCESVISTFSNLENHPNMIGATRKRKTVRNPIKLSSRGIPLNTLPALPEDPASCGDSDSENTPRANHVMRRRNSESAEEKRVRKRAVKEERARRRAEKKVSKCIFGAEERKQKHESVAARMSQQKAVRF
eukprot:212368_1